MEHGMAVVSGEHAFREQLDKMSRKPRQGLAVVSGSTGGIGSSIVKYLAAHGWHVVGITHARSVQKSDIPLYKVDMGNAAHVRAVADNIAQCHGLCDALILAHGHRPVTTPSVTLTVQDFTSVLYADVIGTFVLAQAFGVAMLRAGGHGSIVAISSLHARQTYPARMPYAAAKAAVCSMLRSLALEWGPQGIRVNTILPWQVAGSRTETFVAEAQDRGEDLAGAYLSRSPIRQFIDPLDIAKTVAWLLNTPSVHGAEIVLDGGVSASMWHEPYRTPNAMHNGGTE